MLEHLLLSNQDEQQRQQAAGHVFVNHDAAPSTLQNASSAATDSLHAAQSTGNSAYESAKSTASNAYASAKEMAGSAYESVKNAAIDIKDTIAGNKPADDEDEIGVL